MDTTLPFYLSVNDQKSKQELVKSALKLFVLNGFSTTSVRDIAKEAGYTNPALFKFFESKEAMALTLFENCYRHCAATVFKNIKSKMPFPDAIRQFVAGYAKLIDEQLEPLLYVSDNLRYFWPLVSEETRQASIQQKLLKLVQAGIKEGSIPANVKPEIVTAAILGFLAQFSRMVYFKDFEGKAGKRQQEIETIILRMAGV